MHTREWQFDGVVGPTHNYAGLAQGNLAAVHNAGAVSNPKMAALQGLEKMRFVRNLGMRQAFFPPHYRPLIGELRRAGFSGDLATVLETSFQQAPGLLASVYSSAFMWVANAGTLSPSDDTADGKLHFTPANLSNHFHRSIEADFSHRSANVILHNTKLFSIHNALSMANKWGDEGAANHMRLKYNNDLSTLNIFVYGESYKVNLKPTRYVARQECQASEAIARLHCLKNEQVMYLQQSPAAIDHGVFHNDVIAMSSGSRMVIHEQAFTTDDQKKLRAFFAEKADFVLREVSSDELSLEDAVNTYLFNSQLLVLPTKKYALVAPSECGNHAGSLKLIHRLIEEEILDEVHYLDVRESMRNGGGPACLRLRVILTPEQEEYVHPSVVLTDTVYATMVDWVNKHYRDRLTFNDLRDPQFVYELDEVYSQLETVLNMPGLYDPYRAL